MCLRFKVLLLRWPSRYNIKHLNSKMCGTSHKSLVHKHTWFIRVLDVGFITVESYTEPSISKHLLQQMIWTRFFIPCTAVTRDRYYCDSKIIINSAISTTITGIDSDNTIDLNVLPEKHIFNPVRGILQHCIQTYICKYIGNFDVFSRLKNLLRSI